MTIPFHFAPDEHPRDTLHEFGIRFHGYEWQDVAAELSNGIPLPEGSCFNFSARVAQYHGLLDGPGNTVNVTPTVFVEELSMAIRRNRLPLLSINCIDPKPDTHEILRLAALRWLYGTNVLDMSHLRGVRNLCTAFYEYISHRARGLAYSHSSIDLVLGRYIIVPSVLGSGQNAPQFGPLGAGWFNAKKEEVVNNYPPPPGHHANPPKWAAALMEGIKQPTMLIADDDDDALWRKYMVSDDDEPHPDDDIVVKEEVVKDELPEPMECDEPNEGDVLQELVKTEEIAEDIAEVVVKDEPESPNVVAKAEPISPKHEPVTPPKAIKPALPTPSPTPTPSP